MYVPRLWSMNKFEKTVMCKMCVFVNRLGFAYRPMAWKPTLSAWRGTAQGTEEDDKGCSPRGKRAESQGTVPRGLFSSPRPGTTYSVELFRAAPLRVSCSLSTSHSVMHSSTRRASYSFLCSQGGKYRRIATIFQLLTVQLIEAHFHFPNSTDEVHDLDEAQGTSGYHRVFIYIPHLC